MGVTRKINKQEDIPRRNCMKTKQVLVKAIIETHSKYKDIIFGNDIPACRECLKELKKQQIKDEGVHDQKLMEITLSNLPCDSLCKNIVLNGDMIIDKPTGGNFGPEVDYA